ncbi:MAG TPA: pepsin-like aspartic protease [Kofleriaceae bacterium]|nr:pepsin-like aspartic protease [Kofleriaceae bacterium]
MRTRWILLASLAACGSSHNGSTDAKAADAAPDARPDAGVDASLAGTIAVPLTSLGGVAYTAPFEVGGQTLAAIVDTGSTTAAVAGSTCTTCMVTPEYSAGATAVDQHKTAKATYGDGTGWSGEIYADHAAFVPASQITLDFVSMTSSSGFFRGPYQGIVGLGPDQLLSTGTTSYLTVATDGGMAPEIAFQLCPDKGTMWLGGFDSTATSAAPTYTAMNAQFPYYAVGVADLTVGTTSVGTTASFGPTIVDTGTSLTYMPTAVVTAVTTAVNGSSGFKALFGTQTLSDGGCVSSSTVTTAQLDAMLPAMSITFPGASAPLTLAPSRSYIYVQGGGMFCLSISSSSQLFSGITASLIGDTMLASFVTVIDRGNKQVGFAPEQGCADAQAQVARPVPPPAPGQPWWSTDPRIRPPRL